MRLNQPGESIVVVPSVTPDATQSGTVLQALEERMLFLLFLLRKPRMRVIYVTGRPVPESVVEYYLGLLPGVIPRQARGRLHMVATHDGSARSLAEKLLARPRVLAEIRALIPDPDAQPPRAVHDVRARARSRADARHPALRRRSGAACRSAPRPAAGGCSPRPASRTRSATRTCTTPTAWSTRWRGCGRPSRPSASAIVKLNDGVAGRGNAVVDLRDLPAVRARPTSAPSSAAASRRWPSSMPTPASTRYLAQLAQDGGIVEERVGGVELRSPSVQLRVTPLGEVELLSTHDQLLGGPSGQTYLGCRFPADFGYARAITQEAAKIGERLAQEGVLGRFAVDFVVVRDRQDAWTPYAIELNLRKGGTTHPFLTLQFLTDGDVRPGHRAVHRAERA